MSEQQMQQQLPEEQFEGVAPPPRFLLWLVIGLFILFILGGISVVIGFRSVLTPGQQQRVIDQIPAMRMLLPPTPQGGILPTAAPAEGGISPEDLLAAPPLAESPTPEPTETLASVPVAPSPTLTPTLPPPTVTPTVPPPTATVVVQAPTETFADVAVSIPNLPVSHRNYGFTHIKQTWNNCGPANISMALSFYGWTEDQSVAASFLKPDREDKNVSPGEMVAFVNERTGVRAITRIGGSLELLKQFIAAEFPVIIETGYMPEGNDWLGHYQTVVGYDDLQRAFFVYDSYLGSGENGEGIAESYDSVDANWQHFNRTFIVIYDQSRESRVAEILGEMADLTRNAEIALEVARSEATANPRNAFAWFNIGTALTKLGRYEEAAIAYDEARRVGGLPWRITWYQFGPFEAYYNAGRYDDVMALVNANLTNTQYVEETFYWQGRVLLAQGDTRGAATAFNRAIQANPRFTAAREALDNINS